VSELATFEGEWFQPTALELPSDLPYERWERLGRTLKDMEKGVQFWLGDWLLFGETHYPDRYTQATEETGYTHGALRNMAWVAKEFPVSSRDDRLSFSHYRSLARVPPEERADWIERIKDEEMSVGEVNGRLNHKGYKGTMVYVPQKQLDHLKELARHADLDAQREYATKWNDPL
jgi:hypothetical protein